MGRPCEWVPKLPFAGLPFTQDVVGYLPPKLECDSMTPFLTSYCPPLISRFQSPRLLAPLVATTTRRFATMVVVSVAELCLIMTDLSPLTSTRAPTHHKMIRARTRRRPRRPRRPRRLRPLRPLRRPLRPANVPRETGTTINLINTCVTHDSAYVGGSQKRYPVPTPTDSHFSLGG